MSRNRGGPTRYIVLLACLCLATGAYAAQNARNANSIYAGVSGGVTVLPDIHVSGGGILGARDLETDAGFNVGGVVGFKLAFGLRAEAEISYRQNDLQFTFGREGDLSTLTFMGNAWYDFDTGTSWIPYVGGGLGVARVALDERFFGQIVDDSDTVVAWQIGGGVGYEISRGIVVSADYRYLATEDPRMTDEAGVRFDTEYSSHNMMLSIRGHF